MFATLTDAGQGAIWLNCSYDPGLTAAIKADIAPHLRAYDQSRRQWLFDPSVAVQVAGLCELHLNVKPAVPPIGAAAAVSQLRLLRVLYIGAVKYRSDNSYTATAYVEDESGQGRWSLVLPVGVLRAYFEGGLGDLFSEMDMQDEWSLLGLDRAQAATYTDAQIKQALRLALKKSHPDANLGDPNAKDLFIKVKEAGEVLSDPAGRHFSIMGVQEAEKDRQERLAKAGQVGRISYNYIPPRKTGWMLVSGAPLLGDRQFLASEICKFDDVTDDYGRVLSASIPRGERTPVPHWID